MTKKYSSTEHKTPVQVVVPEDLEIIPAQRMKFTSISFSNYSRALMQNWRQGTVASKDRGEVAFSNKKPWKQKGTGRARAGSRRSPLWRKGGVIFGPQERTRVLKVSKKLRKNVFNALLWQNFEKQSILSLNWAVEGDRPKTALAYQALVAADLQTKKVVLFVSFHDYQAHYAFGNIPNVRIVPFDQPNAYVLAHGDVWVFLQKDGNSFKEMVSAWL
jgi:large subunit ribosomal protein L4